MESVASSSQLEVRRAWMFRAAREAQLVLLRSSEGRIATVADVAAFLERRIARPASEVERHILSGLVARAQQEFECQSTRFAALRISSIAERAATTLQVRFAERWTISRLARELGTNRFTLTKEFQSAVGMGVHQFLVVARVRAAEGQIRRGGAKIDAIAAEVGFANRKTLYSAYRRITGRSLRARSAGRA